MTEVQFTLSSFWKGVHAGGDSGRTEVVPAAGLFILMGAQPFTGWLPEAIKRNQWDSSSPVPAPVRTGPCSGLSSRWRPPPRVVFAIGDVRHGSMKRVAAVGDGSTAIRLIHDYLALAPPYAKVNDGR